MALTNDRFRNVLSAEVISSAANTLTFAEVQTGASLGMRLGVIVDAIDFYPTHAAINEMTQLADQIIMAWTTSDQVSDLEDEADSRILDVLRFSRHDLGTAGSGVFLALPFHRDFTPPLIVAAPKLFLAVHTGGLASAATLRSRLAFRFTPLSAQEYLEIAETFLHG